ncbi:MAG: hypothetical protein U0168_01690 [Nannocystaceae bacterium]
MVRRARNTRAALARPVAAAACRATAPRHGARELVAHWLLGDGAPRLPLLVPPIERAIDDALQRRRDKPRRG